MGKGNLLLAHVLREFGRPEDARTYAVLLYRWASILSKADMGAIFLGDIPLTKP